MVLVAEIDGEIVGRITRRHGGPAGRHLGLRRGRAPPAAGDRHAADGRGRGEARRRRCKRLRLTVAKDNDAGDRAVRRARLPASRRGRERAACAHPKASSCTRPNRCGRWSSRSDRVTQNRVVRRGARRGRACRSAASGSASTTITRSGVLNRAMPRCCEPRARRVDVERRRADDERGDAFAHELVGVADHHRLAHVGVRFELVLDLGGRDVLAAADDHVLQRGRRS